MIDIKQIRENPQKFKDACEAKKFVADIDKLINVDSALKSIKQKLQDISTDKNRIGKSIPNLPADEKQSALSQLAELKQQEAKYSDELGQLQPQFDEIMQQVPQPADDDVPLGKDDTENTEIKKSRYNQTFKFIKIDIDF